MRYALCVAAALVLVSGKWIDVTDEPSTVVLVSIDGFRADYLSPDNTPNLHRLAEAGVQAEYLETIFPSSTFPSHYSIATGLFPVNHGIVSNTMYDPELQQGFSLSNREAVRDSVWWQGEPIWVTLEKQGRTTAPYLWVGTEAKIAGHRPTWWMTYDSSVPHQARIDSVLVALSRKPRPALVTLYFSIVDTQGHRHGPDSPEVREALREVDQNIGTLVDSLHGAGSYENVNLVIVGDHGMAAIADDAVEDLSDYLESPRDALYIVQLGAIPMLNLKSGQSADSILAALKPMNKVQWYKKGDIPERFNYNDHVRIPDIVGIAEPGWRVLIDHEPDAGYSGGTHGYDPAVPSMHTMFIAHGPAFKSNFKADAFSVLDIYELLCAVLDVQPAPNDGDLEIVRGMLVTETDSE